MPIPVDDASVPAAETAPSSATLERQEGIDESDERAALEAELAQLDASWKHRKEPAPTTAPDPALAALEARLSDLNM